MFYEAGLSPSSTFEKHKINGAGAIAMDKDQRMTSLCLREANLTNAFGTNLGFLKLYAQVRILPGVLIGGLPARVRCHA